MKKITCIKQHAKSFFVLLFICIFMNSSLADTFSRLYGGSGDEQAYSIQQTIDGGYIVAGRTHSFGNGDMYNSDIWILKLDSSGYLEWDKTFGDAEVEEMAFEIDQTIDGGYIVAGHKSTSSDYPYSNMYILKLDEWGDTVWTKVFKGSTNSRASSAQQTDEGEYIIAGAGDENILILDSNGRRILGKHYNGNFGSIRQTKDGGYIATGYSFFYNDWDILPSLMIYKLNAYGGEVWSNPLGNESTWRAYGWAALQTNDGGYIIAGDSISVIEDLWYPTHSMILKLNYDGSKDWIYCGEQNTSFKSVQQTQDGNYIAAGDIIDAKNATDVLIVKFDKNGIIKWSRIYGIVWSDDKAFSIKQTIDGGYIIAGNTHDSSNFFRDIWILKLDENGNAPYLDRVDLSQDDLTIFPNPFKQRCQISAESVEIYDLSGRLVQKISCTNGNFIVWQPDQAVNAGIYYLRIIANNHNTYNRKVVYLK